MKDAETIDSIMEKVPERVRYRWCVSRWCACLGCVNNMAKADLSKEEWESWVARNPKPTKGGRE